MRRAVAAGALLLAACGGRVPEVPFAKVKRERLVSTLVTNGKVEPAIWREVRAPRAGMLTSVPVERGAAVRRGQTLATVEAADARAEAVGAQAKLDQAKADLAQIDRGPSPQALAEVEGELSKARLERDVAARQVQNYERLVAANAATRFELSASRDRLSAAEAQLRSVEKRKAAMGGKLGREAALARVREAQAAVDLGRRNLDLAVIASPADGTLYELEARAGAFVQPGNLIARVGRTRELRATVYVDEPELGRVAAGMPVELTWDALPGRRWMGEVEKMPSQIVAYGARQVGEVIVRVENADGALPPGANVNAEIRSKVVENALVAPKETVRRESGVTVVYALAGNKVARRSVGTGTSSVTQVEILSGAKEGDLVALPSPAPLRDGDVVKPVLP